MATEFTDAELKLTAAVYTRHGAATYLKEHGRLPDNIGGSWNVIPMRLGAQERGRDLTLTEDEQLVYDAILREARLPGGVMRLAERQPTDIAVLTIVDPPQASDDGMPAGRGS